MRGRPPPPSPRATTCPTTSAPDSVQERFASSGFTDEMLKADPSVDWATRLKSTTQWSDDEEDEIEDKVPTSYASRCCPPPVPCDVPRPWRVMRVWPLQAPSLLSPPPRPRLCSTAETSPGSAVTPMRDEEVSGSLTLEQPTTIGEPPPPRGKVPIVRKNEIYNRENLIGPFLYAIFWVPDPLPPSPPPHVSLV